MVYKIRQNIKVYNLLIFCLHFIINRDIIMTQGNKVSTTPPDIEKGYIRRDRSPQDTKRKGENNMKKLNNKGFSLVELIVVVLIMAIIAVALAPQVMKWVEESRKSTDANNYDTIVEACNTSLADQNALKESNKNDIVLTADAKQEGNRVWKITGESEAFKKQMNEILGKGWEEQLKVKASETVKKIKNADGTEEWGTFGTDDITYTITVSKGHVFRTCDTTGHGPANS